MTASEKLNRMNDSYQMHYAQLKAQAVNSDKASAMIAEAKAISTDVISLNDALYLLAKRAARLEREQS